MVVTAATQRISARSVSRSTACVSGHRAVILRSRVDARVAKLSLRRDPIFGIWPRVGRRCFAERCFSTLVARRVQQRADRPAVAAHPGSPRRSRPRRRGDRLPRSRGRRRPRPPRRRRTTHDHGDDHDDDDDDESGGLRSPGPPRPARARRARPRRARSSSPARSSCSRRRPSRSSGCRRQPRPDAAGAGQRNVRSARDARTSARRRVASRLTSLQLVAPSVG